MIQSTLDALKRFSRSFKTYLIESGGEVEEKRHPYLLISPLDESNAPDSHVFVRQDTSDRNDPNTVFIQRVVNTDDGHDTPQALKVDTTVNAETDQTEWAISGVLRNHIDTKSKGNVAVSGVSFKYGKASIFGGHFQCHDMNIYESPEDVTPVNATEMNIKAVGKDHPYMQDSTGARSVLDLISRTNFNVDGWDTAEGNSGDAEIGTAIRIRTDTRTDGQFRHGLVLLTGNKPYTRSGIFVHTEHETGVPIDVYSKNQQGVIRAGTNRSDENWRASRLDFSAHNDGEQRTTYSQVSSVIVDNKSKQETGRIDFRVLIDGSLEDLVRLNGKFGDNPVFVMVGGELKQVKQGAPDSAQPGWRTLMVRN